MKRWCFVALFCCSSILGQKAPGNRGKAEFERACGNCHPADVVSGMGNSRQGWKDMVNEMVLRGASVTRGQKAAIVDYLTRNFPLPVESNKAGP